MTPFLRLLLFCAAFALTVAPAAAASVTEQIVAQLSEQGFDRIGVSRTLLGRTRIQASSRDFQREIVVNPATGEILRDYIMRRKRVGGGDDPQAPQIVDPYEEEDGGAGHGGGNPGRDDDEDDEDGEDEAEQDGSGPGDGDDDDDDDNDDNDDD